MADLYAEMAETLTTPELARARIAAIHKAVKNFSIETRGDPAEAVFELICVAVLILEEARPAKPPSELIANAAPHAVGTVEAWFADEIKEMRCRNG